MGYKNKKNNNNNNNNNNNTKRKQFASKEEEHNYEKEIKYSRLVDITSKSIRKEAKVVKSFECQKLVRKIKGIQDQQQQQKDSEGQEANAIDDVKATKESKGQRRIRKLEEKLRLTKELQLDDLVQLCLKRLGIDVTTSVAVKDKQKKEHKATKPSTDNTSDNGDEKEEEESKKEKEEEDSEFYTTLMESMLQHKRLVSVMESMTEQITDYHSWVSHREEWLASSSSAAASNSGGRNKKKKRSRNDDENDTRRGEGGKRKRNNEGNNGTGGNEYDDGDNNMSEYNSGLFINSLAGGGGDDEGQERVDVQPKKKNRMGQRARKAKAMAIEAQNNGQVWDKSINWRKKKPKNETSSSNTGNTQLSASGLDTSKGKSIKVSDVTEMGKNWKEEGKAHPSWAAREAQKSKSGLGIVEFTGKKITFD